jgi:hypothetical protein
MLSDVFVRLQAKGTLTEGRLYADRFQGAFQGKTISDLESAVTHGSVHETTACTCVCNPHVMLGDHELCLWALRAAVCPPFPCMCKAGHRVR